MLEFFGASFLALAKTFFNAKKRQGPDFKNDGGKKNSSAKLPVLTG